MEKPRPSTLAWGGIAAYETGALVNGGGHTLSEGLDPLVDHENKYIKWGSRLAIGYTALHLMSVLPERVDLFHQLTRINSR